MDFRGLANVVVVFAWNRSCGIGVIHREHLFVRQREVKVYELYFVIGVLVSVENAGHHEGYRWIESTWLKGNALL